MRFTDYVSGIQLPDCSKLAINWKNYNDDTICSNNVIVRFFWSCLVSLVKFSYWSKFRNNIITSSRVMIIFFYKGLTRNPEIGNTPVWVLPNIWRLGQVMDTTLSRNVSNKMLLNAAKWQSCSFYRFWVIKAKTTEAKVPTHTPPPALPRLRLKHIHLLLRDSLL